MGKQWGRNPGGLVKVTGNHRGMDEGIKLPPSPSTVSHFLVTRLIPTCELGLEHEATITKKNTLN